MNIRYLILGITSLFAWIALVIHLILADQP